MVGRIITARHGRPDVDRSVKISAREYTKWWADYDLAHLAADQVPPDDLVALAARCDVVISSTLPRAIDTARRLVTPDREVPKDAIYVEAPLPLPAIPFLKLTPTTWGVIARSFWFFGYTRKGVEGHYKVHQRVGEAVRRLKQLAMNGDEVLLCAHGYLNWMLDRRLRRQGWSRVDHQGGNNYWSYRIYEAPAVTVSEKGTAATKDLG